MIVVIIGQSGAGKTHYVLEHYYSDDMELADQPIKHTRNDRICLIGDYKVDRRCKGTDTLPYNALPQIIEFIKRNRASYDIIVAEGDRINSRRFMDFVMELGEVYEVVYMRRSAAAALESIGARATPFIKSTKTKSDNMFRYLLTKGARVRVVENER